MTTNLNTITEELNRLILNDSSLTPELFQRLLAQQHELGLLQGERPTCPFLRPHLISRTRYDAVKAAAKVIAGAFEKVADTDTGADVFRTYLPRYTRSQVVFFEGGLFGYSSLEGTRILKVPEAP